MPPEIMDVPIESVKPDLYTDVHSCGIVFAAIALAKREKPLADIDQPLRELAKQLTTSPENVVPPGSRPQGPPQINELSVYMRDQMWQLILDMTAFNMEERLKIEEVVSRICELFDMKRRHR